MWFFSSLPSRRWLIFFHECQFCFGPRLILLTEFMWCQCDFTLLVFFSLCVIDLFPVSQHLCLVYFPWQRRAVVVYCFLHSVLYSVSLPFFRRFCAGFFPFFTHFSNGQFYSVQHSKYGLLNELDWVSLKWKTTLFSFSITITLYCIKLLFYVPNDALHMFYSFWCHLQ